MFKCKYENGNICNCVEHKNEFVHSIAHPIQRCQLWKLCKVSSFKLLRQKMTIYKSKLCYPCKNMNTICETRMVHWRKRERERERERERVSKWRNEWVSECGDQASIYPKNNHWLLMNKHSKKEAKNNHTRLWNKATRETKIMCVLKMSLYETQLKPLQDDPRW